MKQLSASLRRKEMHIHVSHWILCVMLGEAMFGYFIFFWKENPLYQTIGKLPCRLFRVVYTVKILWRKGVILKWGCLSHGLLMQVFWFSYAELTFTFFVPFSVVTFSLLALRMCHVHCCDFYTSLILFLSFSFPPFFFSYCCHAQSCCMVSLPISLAQH